MINESNAGIIIFQIFGAERYHIPHILVGQMLVAFVLSDMVRGGEGRKRKEFLV